MRKINLFISLVIIVSLVAGCKSTWYAGTKGKEFHKLLTSEKYEKLGDMISQEGIVATPKEEWIVFFEDINKLGGNIESIEKISSEKEDYGDKTKITIIYLLEFEFQEDSFYEEIVFVLDGNKYELLSYSLNKDKDEF
ncbi:MAG: hypothetical protein U9Q83_09225 [Bacteroidota bacterium]|nr:hypothetical protein [Bacteroidota bacterium]